MLAMAEIRGERVGTPLEPDLSECLPRGRPQSLIVASITPKSVGMTGMSLNGERNVVERGELREQ